MSGNLQVEIVEAEALDGAAVALWRAWTAENPDLASPYFRWDYAQIASRVCPGAAIAVFRRDGRIVGFFPHQRRGGALQPLGAPMNDYHGVIAPAGETITLEDVARLLKARRLNVPGWIGAGEAGQTRQTVQAAMPEDGYDAWYAERRTTYGKYFKDKERARRSLEAELGPVRVERGLRDPALLNQLIDLKAAQYRRSGLHDIFACGWTRDLLHALMAERREDFGASMAAMHAGDKLVAVEFSLHAGRHYHFWFPVYEPARSSRPEIIRTPWWRRASPRTRPWRRCWTGIRPTCSTSICTTTTMRDRCRCAPGRAGVCRGKTCWRRSNRADCGSICARSNVAGLNYGRRR